MSFLLSSGLSGTIPDSVIDNFEDALYGSAGSVSDFYSGATGSFARTTTDVISGDKALENTATGDIAIVSTPTDGLNNYPSQGDTIECLFRDPSTARTIPFVLFNVGYDSANNEFSGYGARLDSGDVERLVRFDNNPTSGAKNSTVLDGADYATQKDTYYWVVISTADANGNISVDYYDVNTSDLSRGTLLGSLSATDTTYNANNGIGWFIDFDGTGTFADLLRIV